MAIRFISSAVWLIRRHFRLDGGFRPRHKFDEDFQNIKSPTGQACDGQGRQEHANKGTGVSPAQTVGAPQGGPQFGVSVSLMGGDTRVPVKYVQKLMVISPTSTNVRGLGQCPSLHRLAFRNLGQ